MQWGILRKGVVALVGTISGIHLDEHGQKHGTIRNECGEYYFYQGDLVHEEDLRIETGDTVSFEPDGARHALSVCSVFCPWRGRPLW